MARKPKQNPKPLDLTTQIMGRLAAMPHKPHVAKKTVKKKAWNKTKLAKG